MARTRASLRNALDKFLSTHLADLENDERVEALVWYCQGLGLEIPQKTSLGIAKRLAPDDVQAVRQRIQRAIARGRFGHEEVFGRLQRTLFESESFDAYLVDDTGFEKKGSHSAGVQRQYSGTLGKVGNCQVATTLHAASDEFSVCIDGRLYLPKTWVEDLERRSKAGVPGELEFQSKPQTAIELLRSARANGGPSRPVVGDAGYGDSRDFRESVREIGLHYVVAVSSNTTVWPPGTEPRRPKRTGRPGRPRTKDRDPKGQKPVRVDRLAADLLERGQFKEVTWRMGSPGLLARQFVAVRVQSAERRHKGMPASEEIWLLCERDEAQQTGFKYYLCSLPKSTSLKKLARLAKLRWRIERDYQDMKQKLGLDAYEGRSWGGFHRHLSMVALVHAFLSLNRAAFSPDQQRTTLDLGRLLPSPRSSANSMARHLPDMSANLR